MVHSKWNALVLLFLPDDFFLLFGTVLDEVEFKEGMGTFNVGMVGTIASIAIVSSGVRRKVSQSSAEAWA